jgi:hypothetical protein
MRAKLLMSGNPWAPTPIAPGQRRSLGGGLGQKPKRVPNSGFRPVKITYLWEEDGVDKTDVHVARQESESYAIRCTAQPQMKSIALELAE